MSLYCIEIDTPENGSILFAPTQVKVRGRWTAARVAHHDKSEGMKALSRIEAIPGQCISLDTDKRIGRIFESMAETPDGKRIWAEVQTVLRSVPVEFGDGEWKLHDPQMFDSLSIDDVKTWLFYMAGLMQAKQARVAANSPPLPTQAEVRTLPGKRFRDPANPYIGGLDYMKPEDREKALYTDVVPVDGGGEFGDAGKQKIGKPQLAGAGGGK